MLRAASLRKTAIRWIGKRNSKVIAGKSQLTAENLAATMPSGEALEKLHMYLQQLQSVERFHSSDCFAWKKQMHNTSIAHRLTVDALMVLSLWSEGGDEARQAISLYIAAWNRHLFLIQRWMNNSVKMNWLGETTSSTKISLESVQWLVNKLFHTWNSVQKHNWLTKWLLKLKKISKLNWQLKVNQKKSGIKIIPGKMDRFFQDLTKVDQAYTLLAEVCIMDDSKTVELLPWISK